MLTSYRVRDYVSFCWGEVHRPASHGEIKLAHCARKMSQSINAYSGRQMYGKLEAIKHGNSWIIRYIHNSGMDPSNSIMDVHHSVMDIHATWYQ